VAKEKELWEMLYSTRYSQCKSAISHFFN
jgi:hypothetical protein